MKKIHRAVQTGPNKWEKKTGWKLEKDDFISMGVLLSVIAIVTIRVIIG